jgi:hypothetical protein
MAEHWWVGGPKAAPVKNRLLRHIDIDNVGCWNWTGATKNGYGSITIGSASDGTRHSESTHRASYLEFKGDIPAGMFVCHKCDNKLCINPDHLFVGTNRDNIADCINKGLFGNHKGSANSQSTLTDDDVRKIRSSPLSQAESLAASLGVTRGHVLKIMKGERWAHLS